MAAQATTDLPTRKRREREAEYHIEGGHSLRKSSSRSRAFTKEMTEHAIHFPSFRRPAPSTTRAKSSSPSTGLPPFCFLFPPSPSPPVESLRFFPLAGTITRGPTFSFSFSFFLLTSGALSLALSPAGFSFGFLTTAELRC
jgi:hypothetical protein